MKKILSAIFLSCLFCGVAMAQDDADALRNSQLTFGGTARSMGLAGATGAMGADFSSLSDNPAGIGLYRKNEFTFTPGLDFFSTGANYLGNNVTSRNTNFNISNLGLVWTWVPGERRGRGRRGEPIRQRQEKKEGWQFVSFGLGANRLANFNNTITYTGYNASNSLINSFLENLNANGGESTANIAQDYPFDANLAYATNLITNTNGIYTSPLSAGGVQQMNTITTTGNITEYVVSLGGNYNNKLYVGGTIGFPVINYTYNSVYSETSVNNSVPGFNNFTYSNSVTTTGYGINGKFGLIYRVNDFLRLGAAIHSPTDYFQMHDDYSSNMSSDFTNSSLSTTAYSPNGSFDYSLYTPWKFVGSAIVLFKKYGFISADYEYIDYSQAYYSFDNDPSAGDIQYQNAENNSITTKYGPTNNFKVGGELALDVFRIRLGYAIYQSPFKSGEGVSGFDDATNYVTGGIGFRDDNFFLDLGVVHALNNSFQQPYTLQGGNAPGAQITTASTDFLVTIGIRY